jgi:hypothetical protein
MATNPSNSNAINITNLPQSQLVVDGDLMIVETPNGTQTISWENLNTVKTDIRGNATIVGNVTGRDALFSNMRVVKLSASEIYTSQGQGTDASNDFYDRFTIEDGIVLSATRNTENNPVYTRITQTILPQTTGYLLSLFSRVADERQTSYIEPGQTKSPPIVINSFFLKYPWIPDANAIAAVPACITFAARTDSGLPYVNVYSSVLSQLVSISNAITPKVAGGAQLQQALTGLMAYVPAMSAQPILPTILPGDITQAGNNLQFYISLPYPVPELVRVNWRLLYTG